MIGIYKITIGQIVEGLDVLYSDFKNRNIKINDAIYVVKRQIEGASEEHIEAMLQYLRSGKKTEKLMYKDSDGNTIYIVFP